VSAPLATDWADLLIGPAWQALVAVLAAVALGVIAYTYRSRLGDLAADAGISKLTVMGVELELITRETRAAYAERNQTPPPKAALRALALLGSRLEPLVRGQQVLWIDDKPNGNRHEVELLEALGVEVAPVASFSAAMTRIGAPDTHVDVVITNWTRPADPADGLAVIDRLRDAGSGAPVIFYVGDASAERRAAAAGRGAAGLTDKPDELLKVALVELATAG
jgi:CheY-like chemotaxis protein